MRSPLLSPLGKPLLNPVTGTSPQLHSLPAVPFSLDEHLLLPTPADEKGSNYQAPSDSLVSHGLTTMNLTINVVMSITGTTILGISAQAKRGGIILTPVMIFLGAAIASEMTRLVSITIDRLQLDRGITVRAYQDFVAGAFGTWGRSLSSITCTMDLFVAICIGLVLESQNMQFLVPISWSWFGCGDCGRKWWALLLSSTTLTYSFIDLGPLARFAATIGPYVWLLSISLALIGIGGSVADADTIPQSCRDGMEPYWRMGPNTEGSAFISVASVMSYSFYCFAMVVTVPSLKSEMAEPKKIGEAARNSYCCCAVVFLIILFCGYWVYGNLGPDNLIEGMRCNRPAGWWATTRPWETGTGTLMGSIFCGLITSSMLLIDCTYVPCAVIAVEGVAPRSFERSKCRRACARVCVALFRFFIATEVSSFIALSSLSASLFCVCNNVVIPIAAFYQTGAQKVGFARKCLHLCVFLFACFVVVFGTYSAVEAMLFPPASEIPGVFPRPGITTECELKFREST